MLQVRMAGEIETTGADKILDKAALRAFYNHLIVRIDAKARANENQFRLRPKSKHGKIEPLSFVVLNIAVHWLVLTVFTSQRTQTTSDVYTVLFFSSTCHGNFSMDYKYQRIQIILLSR